MAKTYLFNKPFGVLCQFSGMVNTLLYSIKDIYPTGRLDKDSEGLVILTYDCKLQHNISNTKFYKEKTYIVQVDSNITNTAINRLTLGIVLKDGKTKPAKVKTINQPDWLWNLTPPIRIRKNIPFLD